MFIPNYTPINTPILIVRSSDGIGVTLAINDYKNLSLKDFICQPELPYQIKNKGKTQCGSEILSPFYSFLFVYLKHNQVDGNLDIL